MSNYSPLNIAAGNQFLTAVNIAKTNVELMRLQQDVRKDTAQGINSMQKSCFDSGIASAKNAEKALDNEADGLIESGVVSSVGAGIALGSLAPAKLASKVGIGSGSTKDALEDVRSFKTALNEKDIVVGPRYAERPDNRLTDDESIDNESNESAAHLRRTTARDENQIQTWLGNEHREPDVSNFAQSNKEAVKGLNEDELQRVRKNVFSREQELEEALHKDVSNRLVNLAQVGNSIAQTGNLAQGLQKEDQARNNLEAQIYSTQQQIMEQDYNGLSSFASNAQQSADNFKQESLSILANLNTQG